MRKIIFLAISAGITGAILSYLNFTESPIVYKRIIIILGNISFSNMSSFITTLSVWTLPQIVLFVHFADYIENTIINNYSCIRTRTANFGVYIKKIYSHIMTMVALFYAIIFITVLIIGNIYVNEKIGGSIVIGVYIIFVMYYSFIIILENVISIKFGVLSGVVIVLAIQSFFLYFIKKFPMSIISKFIPTNWVIYNPGNSWDVIEMVIKLTILSLMMCILFLINRWIFNQKEDYK